MWNRRKDEEFATKPASAMPTSSALAKEGIPMSTLPGRINEPHFDNPRGGSAVLGKSVIGERHPAYHGHASHRTPSIRIRWTEYHYSGRARSRREMRYA